MGLGKQLRGLTKEFMTDPKGQYYRHLNTILELHKRYNIPKRQVKKYVDHWYNK